VSLDEHVVEARLLAGNFLTGVSHFQHDAPLYLFENNYFAYKLLHPFEVKEQIMCVRSFLCKGPRKR